MQRYRWRPCALTPAFPYQDAQVGRLLDEIDRMVEAGNTKIMFIEGDNGSSGEGTPRGTTNEVGLFSNELKRTAESVLPVIDKLGGPESDPIFPAGWAWRLDTPFQYMKQVTSHLGGTRNGMILSWPGHTSDPSVARNQFSHIVDVDPTVLQGGPACRYPRRSTAFRSSLSTA